jgi:hypothetical protein
MGKIKKYQPGGSIKGNVPKGVKVDTSKVIKGMNKIMNPKKKDVDLSAPGKGMMKELEKKGSMPASKKNVGRKGVKVSKAKNGKSFPDLNKDGKITKADILKGRGVIKNGGKVKKAQAGLTASNKRVGPVDPKGAWTKVQEMNLPPRNVKTSVSLKKDKELGATKMKMGGGLKPVDKAKNPGLSKLPTPVRNKMGYQKNGGKVKKK